MNTSADAAPRRCPTQSCRSGHRAVSRTTCAQRTASEYWHFHAGHVSGAPSSVEVPESPALTTDGLPLHNNRCNQCEPQCTQPNLNEHRILVPISIQWHRQLRGFDHTWRLTCGQSLGVKPWSGRGQQWQRAEHRSNRADRWEPLRSLHSCGMLWRPTHYAGR